MIVDSIENRPYVRRMIATLGEPDLPVLVLEPLHEQTDEELIETDIKRMDADDQSIQTILLGLPKDVYAAVDSYEIAKEIWEREKFTSTDGESIKSYYHRFMQLMNDLKKNKHFSKNIASNLKFLNNLQPEWKRYVTIVRQTKNLHEADFTQIYDFLKMNQEEMNQEEVNDLRVERLAKSHDPLALMAHSQNSFNFPTTHKDQSSSNINDPTEAMNTALIIFAKAFQLFAPTNNNQRTSSNPCNHQLAQPVMNMGQDRLTQNVGGNDGNKFGQYAGQVAQNRQGFNAWQNGGIQGVQNAGMQSGGNQNGLVVVPGIANQSGTGNVVAARAEGTGNGNQARCYNCRGLGYIARNFTARPRRRVAAYLQTQLLIAQKEEAGIQLQAEEFDFMAAVGYLDEIEEVKANCILMANLQQASTSGTQHDRAPVYEIDGSAEVQLSDNCYDNKIFNMFTQEEQYTDLLEPIPEPQLVPQNDNHVTYIAPSTVQSGGTVETSFSPNEETRAHQETVYRKLVEQVAHETLKLAQESREKMRLLKKEIKPANYAKINHLSGVFVPQTTKSKEELFLSNVSNMVTASKTISIPNEDHSDDTTPSVARKFLNEVKSSLNEEKEYAVLWNNWYTKCEECKYDKISYDKAYNDMQQKVERLQAQLRDLKGTSVTPHVDKPKLSAVTPHSKKLHASTQSHSVPQPSEFNVVRHRNVISSKMFKINPSQMPRVDLVPNKQSSASIRTNSITNSQRHVIVKENVPSASKSSEVKKIVTVEDHRRTLLLSKNRKTMSSECNNIKLAIRNDKSKIVCDTCKQCLVTANHDACLTPFVNVLNSRANKMCANAPLSANQKRHRTQVWKPKQVGSKERLASKPRLPRLSLKWSPSRRSFDQKGKLVVQICLWCVDSGCSKHITGNIKLLINFVWKFLGTVCFGNGHIAAILGYGDLKWGNITITRVYFVEGLGHNLFSVGQFCDVDLEVAFRRNTCFIRDQDCLDLLKGNRSTNLYSINLYDMASASPICLMAHATPTKKSKRASHPLKPVPNSKQRFHLLHMDLCGPMRVASINGKRYVLVIVDDYSRYTWVHFLRTKDETPEVIKNFLKKIYVCLQAPVIIVRTDNGTEFENQVLKEYFDSNDHEDIGKLGAKGYIGFFIGYSANSVAYRVYNRRTRKIMETMNVTFDELSAMAFEQNSSRPGLQNLQTELDRTKERFENYIIKKETEYTKLWNDWYKKCDECKYDKISYDKAYKDMQQKIERLQAQLGDLKSKCKDTSCVSDTRNPLSQKLENENVELEFQVLNYARENAH
nr:hypothetical protein [Tanacetum cinerariifolium]